MHSEYQLFAPQQFRSISSLTFTILEMSLSQLVHWLVLVPYILSTFSDRSTHPDVQYSISFGNSLLILGGSVVVLVENIINSVVITLTPF